MITCCVSRKILLKYAEKVRARRSDLESQVSERGGNSTDGVRKIVREREREMEKHYFALRDKVLQPTNTGKTHFVTLLREL